MKKRNVNQRNMNQIIINQHNENIRKSKTRRIIDCFIFYNEFDIINYINYCMIMEDYCMIMEDLKLLTYQFLNNNSSNQMVFS